MKRALITGANKGIGFEIAKQLLQKGYFIILTARDEKKGNIALEKLQAISENVFFIKMDVSDSESVKAAVKIYSEKFESLDVLVNNAGILVDKSAIDMLESEVLMKTLTTNTIGPFLVTKYFLPLINKNGRIINISSELGSLSKMGSYSPAYSISKTALNAVTKQFAGLLEGRAIAVNSVCPGWVKTDMGGSGAQLPVEKGAETAVWLATEAPVSLTGKLLKNKNEIGW